MDSRFTILWVVLFGAWLASCSVMQAYPGPKLPPEQVARVHGTFRFWGIGAKTVELKSIDDTPVKSGAFGAGDVEVVPGRHTVSAEYFRDVLNLVQSSRAPCFITWDAEAGHTYRVNGELGHTWHCWIEDTGTYQRIDGTFSPPSEWKRGAEVQPGP
jgi:hypothetical protein